MRSFDFHPRTRVVFGEGSFGRLGELARDLSFARTLIVADGGIVAAGYVARATAALDAAGIASCVFHEFDSNPDTAMVEAGRICASSRGVDSLVAVGGGSSLDCAKGINFVLTNGGSMRDYRGFGKATRPMLPAIGVPTTAGTGSEAQSYAIISDAETHVKMACGDPKAAFQIAILDPALTVSQPRSVTAVAGFDAISHAVESYVTTARTAMSDLFARDAWRRLDGHYERVLTQPDDLTARGAMLVGAHEAGIAIEQSMLGATHACANPLTAHHDTTHGVAIAVMLPHVVRWNADHVGDRYGELLNISRTGFITGSGPVAGQPHLVLAQERRSRLRAPRQAGHPVRRHPQGYETASSHFSGHGAGASPAERLAGRLEELRSAGGLPSALRDLGIAREEIPMLAAEAATQWTGTFNPRPFDAAAALTLYERAY